MSTRDGDQHGHVQQSGYGITPPRPSATFLEASAAPAEGRGDVSPPRPPPAPYESSKILDQIPARSCATEETSSTPAGSDRKWSIVAGGVPRPVPVFPRFAERVPSADTTPTAGASSSAAGRYRCPRPRPPFGGLQESILGVEIHDAKGDWKRKVAKEELPSPSSSPSSSGTFFFRPVPDAAAAEKRGNVSPRSAPASFRERFLMQRPEGSGATQESISSAEAAERKCKIVLAGVPPPSVPLSLRFKQRVLSAESAAPGTSSSTASNAARSAGPQPANGVAGLYSRPPPQPLSPQALCTCKCEICKANSPNLRPPGPAEAGASSISNSEEAASSSSRPKFAIGSNYWAHLPASEDLNPAGFYSPHPLWEGFAIPAKEAEKSAFRCVYCARTLLGTADKGVKHLLSNRQCSIPDAHQEILKNKMDAYQRRKHELLKRKRA